MCPVIDSLSNPTGFKTKKQHLLNFMRDHSKTVFPKSLKQPGTQGTQGVEYRFSLQLLDEWNSPRTFSPGLQRLEAGPHLLTQARAWRVVRGDHLLSWGLEHSKVIFAQAEGEVRSNIHKKRSKVPSWMFVGTLETNGNQKRENQKVTSGRFGLNWAFGGFQTQQGTLRATLRVPLNRERKIRQRIPIISPNPPGNAPKFANKQFISPNAPQAQSSNHIPPNKFPRPISVQSPAWRPEAFQREALPALGAAGVLPPNPFDHEGPSTEVTFQVFPKLRIF